jgi:hypothetical protein
MTEYMINLYMINLAGEVEVRSTIWQRAGRVDDLSAADPSSRSG